LTKLGLKVERQKKIFVYYEGILVGDYCSDLSVQDVIICELKAKEHLREDDEIQLMNYLKATHIEVGLLLNFGRKPELKRKIYDNQKKAWLNSRITPI
jgi:GxxExxY protein